MKKSSREKLSAFDRARTILDSAQCYCPGMPETEIGYGLRNQLVKSAARADAVLIRLRRVRDNAEWFAWMRNEKTFQFSADETEQRVTLIDYDELSNNDFLVTNQFWVDGGSHQET